MALLGNFAGFCVHVQVFCIVNDPEQTARSRNPVSSDKKNGAILPLPVQFPKTLLTK
jgi:hypothetical protein